MLLTQIALMFRGHKMGSDISARAMCVNPIQHDATDVQLEETAHSPLEIIDLNREKVKFFPAVNHWFFVSSGDKFLHTVPCY